MEAEAVHPSGPVDSPASRTRVVVGGFLMGLANLVPGVSGGTMILAVGLYDRFIGAVADLTGLRWKRDTLAFVLLLGIGLGVAVLGLATPAVWLVTEHRWIAYSLFVGMTLGGVPLLWRVVHPIGPGEVVATLAGLGGMVLVAFGLSDSPLPQNFVVFTLVGALAASSMILPGISGSYILLIFGMYDVVVGSLRPRELLDDLGGSLGVLVPVLIGVAIGIGALSNVLKVVLARFERPAHACLLGLLLGSVLGLFPFQEAVHPELASKERVEAVHLLVEGAEPDAIVSETGISWTAEETERLRALHAGRSKGDLKLMGLELQVYAPGAARAVLALLLAAGGFLCTRALGSREG